MKVLKLGSKMRTVYIAPKGIINHPGVETCDFGPDSGIEDYRHDVWLREGWSFRYGRMAGCRGGSFHTVADFLFAEPIPAKLVP